jgi:hypothetical protein
MLPDTDAIAFGLGIPYGHALGHGGFSHSFFLKLSGPKICTPFTIIVALLKEFSILLPPESIRFCMLKRGGDEILDRFRPAVYHRPSAFIPLKGSMGGIYAPLSMVSRRLGFSLVSFIEKLYW